jgi:ferric-dicitrate binding protein FerR (iron transport regulator)
MEERIKYLFRQYLENTCSREELEELFVCVRQSEHDAILRNRIRALYDAIRKNPSLQTYVDEGGNLLFTEPEPGIVVKQPGKKRRPAVMVAGIFVLAIAGLLWLLNKPARPGNTSAALPMLTKKITERSEYKYLLLPDSTQVWLNAGSSLEFPDHFNEGKREVFLSGEAYFDVKHADKIPFIIHTGKISTTVLGTAFNIKAYPGRKNIIVSVSRGKVSVSRDNELIATLIRGQQLKLSSGDNRITEKNIAVTQVAAWQQGNMVYEDERLEDIIADLERMYNVKIRIENASIQNLQISTSFRREIGIEQALEILCKLTDTGLKQTAGEYIIQ